MSGGSIRSGMLLLLFLATVTTSGCVIPGLNPPLSGQGIVISGWKPDFSRVYPNEDVTLYSNVKNVGSFQARNVYFQLTDLDGWSNVKVSDRDCESGNIELLAPNLQYGTEGEEKMCSWTATSPEIEAGLHMVYTPKITVCYDYVGRTVLRTPSISRYELKRLQDSGSGLPSQSTISGDSPVSISASTPSPIIVTETQVTFPVKISVDNGGGGMLCLPGGQKSCIDSEKMNKVGLEIKSTTASVVECPAELLIWSNRGEVTCDMSMHSRTPNLVQNEIEITARYRYCVDASTNVEVHGR